MDQVTLADRVDVNVNTTQNMEAKGEEPMTSAATVVRAVQVALEAAGIEFLNHGRPGVRLKEYGGA
jgi:hypothetical protein